MITDSWNDILRDMPPGTWDTYFTEQYVRLYADGDATAKAFVYVNGGRTMVLPFLSKEITMPDRSTRRDFETAYGYGGPVWSCADSGFRKESLMAFRSEMADAGYIAGFMRFHPLLKNHDCFETIGSVFDDRKTIAIDLEGGSDRIWNNEIHTKNRNVIRKALKTGLTFSADYDFESLDRFKELYRETMDRLSAAPFYYFDDRYFDNLKSLRPSAFIGRVSHNDRIIAAAIFFFEGPYGHYHLAGSETASLALSPNSLLLWGASCELASKGVRMLHLGGGTTSSPDDSLFMFKHKFSRSEQDFRVGQLILDREAYDLLCRKWEENNSEKIAYYGKRLLKYRF